MQPSQQTQRYFTLQQLLKIYINLQRQVYKLQISDTKIGHEKQIINQSQQQSRIILLFGSISSGKTTLQYYLCGDGLTYGVDEKKQLPYIIPNEKYKNAAIQKTPSKVTTRVPNIRPNYTKYTKNIQKIVFVQIPDIKQLKEQQQSVEYLLLQRIFKTFTQVHILLVIEESSLDDASQLIQDFERVTQLFNLQNQQLAEIIANSMSIIVNKVDENSEQSEIKQKLQQVNNDLISQENSNISSIIKKILQNDKIYLIKSALPNKKDQQQLFSLIAQNTYSKFSQFNIQPKILQPITNNEQSLTNMIEKQQLQQLWKQSVQKLQQLITYLADQPNRQKILSQMGPLTRNAITKGLHEYYGHSQQLDDSPSSFYGKLDDQLKQHMYNLIKHVNNLKEYSAFNYSLNEVYNSLYQLKQAAYKTLLPTSSINTLVYLNVLVGNCNELLIMILYITQVLNYSPESQNQDVQVLSKESLIAPTQEMLAELKKRFHEFNLQLLAVQKKKGKTHKRVKKIQQQPIVTIVQLRNQFIKLSKAKKSISILNDIFNLPNTHFKLYMLIQEFKPNHEFRNKSQFQNTIAIIKQISRILSINHLFIDSVKFLLLVPDWNRIEQLVKLIQDKENLGKNGASSENYQEKKESFMFLNRLGMYATKKRRIKLAKIIQKLVDGFIQIQWESNPQFDHKPFTQQRNQANEISDTWYTSYVQALYIDQLQSTKLMPVIVQKVKNNEQKDQARIDEINRFNYLMSQDIISAKN